MIRTLSFAIALTLAASSASALQCRDPVTKRFIPCKAAVVAAPGPVAVVPARAVVVGHPHCVKGKPCGGSCIAMAKVCHKPG